MLFHQNISLVRSIKFGINILYPLMVNYEYFLTLRGFSNTTDVYLDLLEITACNQNIKLRNTSEAMQDWGYK